MSAKEAKATETAVVKQDTSLPAGITPEMMNVVQGETLDSGDIIIPRVSIVQGLSGSAKEAKPGNWFNELTRQEYGPSITAVILDVVAGYVKYDDSTPPQIISVRWKSPKVRSYNPELITDAELASRTFVKGQRSKITDAYCYIALVNDSDLCLITLKSAACKAARALNSLLMRKIKGKDGVMQSLPFFAQRFELSTKYVEDGQKKYYEPVIRPVGVNEGAYLAALYHTAKDMSKKTVSHDEPEKEQAAGAEKPF